jgi:hypothetical protein
LHWSSEHTIPSLVQAVPEGRSTFAGQTPLDPLQTSAGSQTPVEARQVVPAELITLPDKPCSSRCRSRQDRSLPSMLGRRTRGA